MGFVREWVGTLLEATVRSLSWVWMQDSVRLASGTLEPC